MAPSSPTTPKLRRSSTNCSGEQDVEKGTRSHHHSSDDDLEVPLIHHSLSDGPIMEDGSIKTKNALPSPAKSLCSFLLAVLAAPWICWIAMHCLGSVLREESCPVKQWHFPDCSSHLTHTQGSGIPPLVTPEEWSDKRRKFQQSVQGKTSSLGQDWEKLTKIRTTKDGKQVEEPNTGFRVGVDLKYSPGKGRGVYATETIKKGEQIWDSRYRGIFDSECAAKVYFSKLTNDEQCSAMFWGYNNNFYGRGFQYMTDLDGHGYFNHCENGSQERNAEHHFAGEPQTTNYGLPHLFTIPFGTGGLSKATLERRRRPGSHGMYATRDIQPGEEICFDYSEIQMNSIFDYYMLQIWTHSLSFKHWAVL